ASTNREDDLFPVPQGRVSSTPRIFANEREAHRQSERVRWHPRSVIRARPARRAKTSPSLAILGERYLKQQRVGPVKLPRYTVHRATPKQTHIARYVDALVQQALPYRAHRPT